MDEDITGFCLFMCPGSALWLFVPRGRLIRPSQSLSWKPILAIASPTIMLSYDEPTSMHDPACLWVVFRVNVITRCLLRFAPETRRIAVGRRSPLNIGGRVS